MSFKLKILPIAFTDLQKAKKWYKKRSVSLAEEFKIEVDNEIKYIGKHPEHYQRKYKEFRQSNVTRFPYAIFYLFEKELKQVTIFGILHMSRNPEIIRKRI